MSHTRQPENSGINGLNVPKQRYVTYTLPPTPTFLKPYSSVSKLNLRDDGRPGNGYRTTRAERVGRDRAGLGVAYFRASPNAGVTHGLHLRGWHARHCGGLGRAPEARSPLEALGSSARARCERGRVEHGRCTATAHVHEDPALYTEQPREALATAEPATAPPRGCWLFSVLKALSLNAFWAIKG